MLSSWKKIPQIKRHAIVGAIICLGMLIYSFFAVDSVLDFMSRTVIMMLFASALNIILGFGGLRPLGMATYFGMGSYADEISVLRDGELIASGTPDEIKQNEYVQQAYLGGDMS